MDTARKYMQILYSIFFTLQGPISNQIDTYGKRIAKFLIVGACPTLDVCFLFILAPVALILPRAPLPIPTHSTSNSFLLRRAGPTPHVDECRSIISLFC
uniref:Uncharacterized protein n=1 Tax=Hordeum vulgare subsp. vulgare TaxID=112509 RepID=A0A8I6WPZ9_HORVV